MLKILLTGVNGFLGQHLCRALSHHYKVVATGRGPQRAHNLPADYLPADLTSEQEVATLIHQHRPDIIIHNAAMSKPNECNDHRDLCLKANVESTRYLLRSTAKMLYISTDFVFGEGGPHHEEDPTGPLNFYGQSKLMAEQLVLEQRGHHAIMRPVLMYGPVLPGMKPTFLHWVQTSLQQQKAIKVVGDQWRTPTFVGDICTGLIAMIKKEVSGIYHLAGKDVLSPYQMAIKTAEILHLDTSLITEVDSSTFPEPVQRAKKSGLYIDKARRDLQYEPHSFEAGLTKTFGL